MKNIKANLKMVNKYQTKVNEWHRKKYYERRQKIIDLLSGKCCKCGFSDKRALQIDHINGGGSEHRRHCSSVGFTKYILEHLDEFQLLCANCNQIKKNLNNEFPDKYIKSDYDEIS